jgi:hypothetical protein
VGELALMQMKPANIATIIVKLIAAVMLFAALGSQPHDYYTLLHWVACGVCAYTAFQSIQNKQTGWLCIFAIAAVVLNPIAPLHLKRDDWSIVDVAVAVLLLVSIAILDIRKGDGKGSEKEKSEHRPDDKKSGHHRENPSDKPNNGFGRN